MNRYPIWKNLLVVVVVLTGLLYALPNVFDQDPSMEISGTRLAQVDSVTGDRIKELLGSAGIVIKSLDAGDDKLLLRFADSETQLRAKEVLEVGLGSDYTIALTLSTDVPGWLRGLGALPMYLRSRGQSRSI